MLGMQELPFFISAQAGARTLFVGLGLKLTVTE